MFRYFLAFLIYIALSVIPVVFAADEKSDKKLNDGRVSVVLENATLLDLVKLVYGDIANKSWIISPDVIRQYPINISLRDLNQAQVVREVDRILFEAGLRMRSEGSILSIDKATDPEDEIIVYKPIYRPAKYLTEIVQSVTNAKSLMTRFVREGDGMQQKAQSTENKSRVQSADSQTSAFAQVDRFEVDQVAFSVAAKDVAKVKKLLSDLDTPTGEIILKAAVYEVGTSKADGSAVQLALTIAGIKATLGASMLRGAAVKVGIGGIEAVLQSLDADTRFKSVSRPQIRVKNGSQARFSVGSEVPVITGSQTDKGGNPIQSVDYKPAGVILTVRPEIREGIIELDLNQELSSFTTTTTGVNFSPTLIKRAISSKFTVKSGELVVLAGLIDEGSDNQAERLPFLGWPVNQQNQERKTELLIFVEAQKLDFGSKSDTSPAL